MPAEKSSPAVEREFVIARVFDAPRDLVWKAWTEPKRLMRWWGPKGYKMKVANVDLKPGGTFHYGMKAPDGSNMWGKFVFQEIVAPELLVFVVSFSDEKGIAITLHPLNPDWPREILSTVTFTEHDDQTMVTVRWIPINATETERKTFQDGYTSMQQGWTGTLEQLADYLAKA